MDDWQTELTADQVRVFTDTAQLHAAWREVGLIPGADINAQHFVYHVMSAAGDRCHCIAQ